MRFMGSDEGRDRMCQLIKKKNHRQLEDGKRRKKKLLEQIDNSSQKNA